MSSNLLFKQLHAEMTDRPFLKNNPVLTQVKSGALGAKNLAEAVCQYVRFPEEIVKMLQGAAAHFPVMSPVHQELQRNWGQENGSATGGIPHVEILKHALQRDLAIDASRVNGAGSTERFIASVLDGMRTGSPWFALGQAYALESSAVPELAIIVGPGINLCADLIGKPRPIKALALNEQGSFILPTIHTAEEAFAMDMSSWFALHIIDFEVGHRDNLREVAAAELTTHERQTEFANGFRRVLDAMDEWWNELAAGK